MTHEPGPPFGAGKTSVAVAGYVEKNARRGIQEEQK
jgi:hypothetical protein